jgi:hypothetical protein
MIHVDVIIEFSITIESTSQCRRKQGEVCVNTTRRARKRTRTIYECIECNVGLCLSDCSRDYHTLK